MKNTKLITLLKSFSQTERQKYQELVNGKYHNRSGRGVRLLAYLMAFAPEFEGSGLKKETVFKAVFPKMSYTPQWLNDDMGHLFSLAKTFLADQELSTRKSERDLLALTQIRNRKLKRIQKAELNKIEGKLESVPFRGEKELLTSYKLAGEQNLFIDQTQGRATGESVQQKLSRLDDWYLYAKLRDSCELINRGNIFRNESEFPLLKAIRIFLEKNLERFLHLPAISLYQKAFLTLSQPEDPIPFRELVEELTQHLHQIPDWEARNLFRYAQNHCIRKINLGESQYYREIFSLFQTQTEAGILLSDGQLNHTTFTNIVTTALRLKEFDWAHTFMKTHVGYLPPEKRETVYGFNRASYFFEKKQLSEAIRLLRDLEIKDSFYQASARVLLSKAYFEQQEWESLTYLMDTFKRSLNRNKILSKANRSHYLNFLRYLKKIALLSERKPSLTLGEFTIRMGKIRGQLEEAGSASNLEWLKEKVG